LRAAVRGYRAVLVANRLRRDGLSSSVRCGLRHARYAAAALLVPVDLCHLERRDMARLIARWRGARRRVAARRIGGEAAAPLILPRRLFARARDVVGDVGLKTLVRNLPSSDITLVSLASAGFDVDTAGDLERARRHARPRTSSPGARDQPG
jgi:CTP:molybdopterin cytidylyltransferase MocA